MSRDVRIALALFVVGSLVAVLPLPLPYVNGIAVLIGVLGFFALPAIVAVRWRPRWARVLALAAVVGIVIGVVVMIIEPEGILTALMLPASAGVLSGCLLPRMAGGRRAPAR